MEIAHAEQNPRTFCVLEDGVLIGRSEAAAVRLDDPQVSSAHATIGVGAEHYFIVDQSSNGTFFGQERKEHRLEWGVPRKIQDGDTYLIADYSIACSYEVADAPGPVDAYPTRGRAAKELDPLDAVQRMKLDRPT